MTIYYLNLVNLFLCIEQLIIITSKLKSHVVKWVWGSKSQKTPHIVCGRPHNELPFCMKSFQTTGTFKYKWQKLNTDN